MLKKLILYCLCSFLFFISITTASAQDYIQSLIGKDYFPAVHQSLSQAKDSIDILMYFIISDPSDLQNPVNLLLDDLIQAHRRGVKVRAILEDSKFKENYFAYQLLTQNGIAVFFDSPQTLLHTKAVVIDKRISIIGSANWSKAALEDNHEISLLVDSTQTAQEILDSISELQLNENLLLPQGIKGIPVSTAFLLNPDAGYQLLKNRANQAFDLYLLLLKESHLRQTDTFTISCSRLQRRLLKTLQDRYRLIKYNPQENRVTLQQKPTSGYFSLPPEYWEYRLSQRLSLRAKYLYLISLSEAAKSTRNPYWFRSQEDLSRLYHLSDYTISLGLQELEREGIIEITRSVSPADAYGQRKANIYRLNPLISPEQFQRALNDFKEKYDTKITRQAQKLSAQLNEPKDLEDIQTFIKLIQEYGYPQVQRQNSLTAKSKKGSGLYDISHTIDLLK